MIAKEFARRRRVASAKWKAKNPNYAKRYYRKHRLERIAREKARRAANPEYYKKYLRDWNAKRRERKLRGHTHCAICRKPLKPRNSFIDHCHATAKRICNHVPYKACKQCQRDVICPSCNSVIGLVKENLRRLESIQRYLRKWNRILRRKHVGV